MPKPTIELLKFLEPFPKEVQENALWLRDFVWKLYPNTNELIYDNYNALAIGWSPTDSAGDAFCSIAVYSKYVNFGFNRGSEINDNEKKLKGKGNLYRYIRVQDKDEFPKTYIKKLLKEAYVNSMARLKKGKPVLKRQIIVKMSLTKKRRPIKEK